MPLVYICSPFRGDEKGNAERARKYCRFAYERGAMPIAPHLFYPQFLDDADPMERRDGLAMADVWLDFCDEVWVFGSVISDGMRREIDAARKAGKLIRNYQNE